MYTEIKEEIKEEVLETATPPALVEAPRSPMEAAAPPAIKEEVVEAAVVPPLEDPSEAAPGAPRCEAPPVMVERREETQPKYV